VSAMDDLALAVLAGDRRALARAITLVESSRAEHRHRARALLRELLPRTGGAARIGISGAPGAGKSTLLEALGCDLVARGHRPAVLAVDPASARGGGAILGDKTRMWELSRRPEAFIRPSPSDGAVGGIALRTRETILLVEAAGHDVVLVETVGAGQAEHAVAGMDMLTVLAVAPGGGDELQALKRGIMEVADLVVVTKADGELAGAAGRALAEHQAALALSAGGHSGRSVEVRAVSAMTGEGIPKLADAILARHEALADSGRLGALRGEQRVVAMWDALREAVLEAAARHTRGGVEIDRLERGVREGELLPEDAAAALAERVPGLARPS